MNCYQRRWCCDRSRNASYLLRPGSGVCGPCSHWTWIFHQMMEWCWVHPTRWAAGESGSIWLMIGNLGGTVMLHLPLWQELFPKESLYIVESAWTAPNSMRTLRWFHPLGLILAPHNSLMSKDNLGKTDCWITAGPRMLVPCVCLMINSKAFKQNKRIAVKINLEGPRPEVHKV